MNAAKHPQRGFGSNRRHSVVGVGVVFASAAVTAYLVWNLLDFWHWQSLVVVLTAVCLLLFQRLASQLRCLERSEETLRLAKEEAEQARKLAEETNRQHLEAQRIGKIGHWYTDEASGTTTWSPQMFEMVGIPPKPALSAEEARSFVHRDDIAAFLTRVANRSRRERRRESRTAGYGPTARPAGST